MWSTHQQLPPGQGYPRAGHAHRQSCISADTALRLARYFSTSVEFWKGIQAHCETETVKMALGDPLEKEVKVRKQVA